MQVYLPLIFKQRNLNIQTARICAEQREFCANTIKAVYGPVPMATWCEALWEDQYYTMKRIEYIVSNIYNIHNIGVYFEFTNTLLTDNDLKDRWCNQLLKVLSNNNINGVIVASNLLEKYIKENYPSLDIIFKYQENNKIYYTRNGNNIPLLNQFEVEPIDYSELSLNYSSPIRSKNYNQETFFERKYDFIQKENTSEYLEAFIGGLQRPTLDLVESYTYYLAKSEKIDLFRLNLLFSIYNDFTFEF